MSEFKKKLKGNIESSWILIGFVFNTCILLKVPMIPTFKQFVRFRKTTNPAYCLKVLWRNKAKTICIDPIYKRIILFPINKWHTWNNLTILIWSSMPTLRMTISMVPPPALFDDSWFNAVWFNVVVVAAVWAIVFAATAICGSRKSRMGCIFQIVVSCSLTEQSRRTVNTLLSSSSECVLVKCLQL